MVWYSLVLSGMIWWGQVARYRAVCVKAWPHNGYTVRHKLINGPLNQEIWCLHDNIKAGIYNVWKELLSTLYPWICISCELKSSWGWNFGILSRHHGYKHFVKSAAVPVAPPAPLWEVARRDSVWRKSLQVGALCFPKTSNRQVSS